MASNPWKKNFTQCPNEIYETDLKMGEKFCYSVLCSFADNDTKEAYVKIQTIADRMGAGRSTTKGYLNVLEDRGYIHVTRTKKAKDNNTPNTYKVIHPTQVTGSEGDKKLSTKGAKSDSHLSTRGPKSDRGVGQNLTPELYSFEKTSGGEKFIDITDEVNELFSNDPNPNSETNSLPASTPDKKDSPTPDPLGGFFHHPPKGKKADVVDINLEAMQRKQILQTCRWYATEYFGIPGAMLPVGFWKEYLKECRKNGSHPVEEIVETGEYFQVNTIRKSLRHVIIRGAQVGFRLTETEKIALEAKKNPVTFTPHDWVNHE